MMTVWLSGRFLPVPVKTGAISGIGFPGLSHCQRRGMQQHAAAVTSAVPRPHRAAWHRHHRHRHREAAPGLHPLLHGVRVPVSVLPSFACAGRPCPSPRFAIGLRVD